MQQFLNKEGPSYDQEFMLDIEINYDSETCTIHHINLPFLFREQGLGSRIILEIEKMAQKLGMKVMYIPSEHRATSFWLKNGFDFTFSQEKDFLRKTGTGLTFI
ncbi:hypothetical protein SY88_02940 [Clostridiales bacterium PH28_bin88]|nr:hypothetical protein SY88_02940 [Clostridiales bacterium PH28_bin88]